MQFNRHSGVHLVCIQMSVQIIAIANEPPSAILLILLTRGVNCCCSKATSGVWGHHLASILMYNTLICKQFMFNSSCGAYKMVHKNSASYLFKRSDTYYFSKQIPTDIRHNYTRSRIVICLKTACERSAIIIVSPRSRMKINRFIVMKLICF